MGNCNELHSTQLKDFNSLRQEDHLRLLEFSESITLPKGTFVFEENEPLSKLYCIKKGACKFSITDAEGQEHILRFLGQGDVMGKRSLITHKGARVTATTLMETELCCLEKEELLKNLAQNRAFCRDFMYALIDDVNNDDNMRVQFYMKGTIKEQLAKLFLYLQQKFGTNDEGKLKIKLKREDIAAVLGTSPEYIINLMKKFKTKKLIRARGSDVFILSKLGLDEIVG